MANDLQLNALMAAIPAFHGKEGENVHFFIRNISDVCNIQNWNDENRILLFRLYCRDKAQEYVANDPEINNIDNFENFVRLFRAKFSREENFQETSYLYSNIKQKPKQTVKELADVVKKLVNRMVPDADDIPQMVILKQNLMFNKFLEALRPDIKTEVLKLGKENFDDLVSSAMDCEKALEQQCSYSVNTINATQVSGNSSQDSLITILLKQQENSNKLLQSMAEQLKGLKEERAVCHICNKQHNTKDCWFFPSLQNREFFSPQQNFSGQGYSAANQASNFLSPNSNSPNNGRHFENQGRNFGGEFRRGSDNNVQRFNRGRGRNNYRPYRGRVRRNNLNF